MENNGWKKMYIRIMDNFIPFVRIYWSWCETKMRRYFGLNKRTTQKMGDYEVDVRGCRSVRNISHWEFFAKISLQMSPLNLRRSMILSDFSITFAEARVKCMAEFR
ncbi:uncharacterized protein LOC135161205 isoform X3 [Diachasmimorpha longicaudata]|uniref:uncharacterized protein LOC135161205 isoform X3 n=1 Tax=Diachasmimorpha longicaudata TaxID=58733 RepID=UPI0030B8F185